MKVSIGTNVKDGPWGGGNLFAINLTNYLVNKNHKVVYNLNDDDIDIILLTEPRKTSESSAFTHIDVVSKVFNFFNDVFFASTVFLLLISFCSSNCLSKYFR